MDIINIRWLCAAVLFVPLAAQASKVSTEVAAGTTHYSVTKETISAPRGSSVTAVRDINSPPTVQRLTDGSLRQPAKGRLFIASKNAGRIEAPIRGAFVVGKESIKQGAKGVLASTPAGRLALGGMIAYEGLQALLDLHDWSVDESGELIDNFEDPLDFFNPYPNFREEYPDYSNAQSSGAIYSSGGLHQASMSPSSLRTAQTVRIAVWPDEHPPIYTIHACPFNRYGGVLIGTGVSSDGLAQCTYLVDESKLPSPYPPLKDEPEKQPKIVTPQQINDAIDNDYDPQESDWDALFPHIAPDSFGLDSIPSYSTPKSTSTKVDHQTGDITTIENWTDISFDIDNSNPTKPSVSVTEKVNEDTYINGELQGSTSSETVTKPEPVPTPDKPNPVPDTGSGGNFDFELPSFCSWATVVCDWIGWTKEMPDGDKPDLRNLIQDVDFARSTEITFGTKQCPEPLTLTFNNIIKPVKISFDPFCQLAGYLYYLVMAAAYLIAIRITLGSSNG